MYSNALEYQHSEAYVTLNKQQEKKESGMKFKIKQNARVVSMQHKVNESAANVQESQITTGVSVPNQFDSIYHDLQRDKSISRVERNELLRENFENILLKNLNKSISGYFYKRKSYYFDKKDKLKSNFLSGLFSKLTATSTRYDRRFFKLDIRSSTFSYAKDESQIDSNPHYKVMLRDIVSVSKNMVSMPYETDSGEI